ncbi:MAG: HNH endonuclease signature motif containing protein, partial [Pseudolabrys sp.]
MKENPMHAALLDQFDRELEVEYRDERYLVRDNGLVCRQRKSDRRKRPLDDIWTFGSPNASTGYMHIGSEVVHRIVASAFHGEQPSEKHIVDHIDTNRRNNRVENLRWITRLDNVLLNPITRHRIIVAYGSLETFFENPAALAESQINKNFEWMRTVSKEEAQECHNKFLRWTESSQVPQGGYLGAWVYRARHQNEPAVEEMPDVQSLTPIAIQRNWKTPTSFDMCPDEISPDVLTEYVARLKFGTVFARNSFSESLVAEAKEGHGFLSVLCRLWENPVKEWALAKVTVENGKLVHENIRTFFSLL